jgi:hypothetical protein
MVKKGLINYKERLEYKTTKKNNLKFSSFDAFNMTFVDNILSPFTLANSLTLTN